MDKYLGRRDFMASMAAVAVANLTTPSRVFATQKPLITKPIPKTGEQLPVIGMGTSGTFEVDTDVMALRNSTQVLKTFFEMGGSIIDSSPMYGSSEKVLGHCLSNLDQPDDLYAATKVWTTGEAQGIQQMTRSAELWGIKKFDLMAVHNFSDWKTQLKTLERWKQEGRIRHIGVTTSHGRSHADMIHAIVEQPVYDWVQFTYSIHEREAEKKLLPLALEHGKAVMVNRPFGRGGLFSKVRGKSLPDWAGQIDVNSWGQFFLKFVISHPAVTCAIPATSKVKHMRDNMGACLGRLPDEKMRAEMVRYMEAL